MLVRLVLLLLLILQIVGCELFTTREPEPPTGSTGDGWQFPTTPGILMNNLVTAVGRRSEVDYMRTFESRTPEFDEFHFIADPEADANHPGIFDSWGYKQEQGFVQSLLATSNLPLDSLALLYLDIDREIQRGDTADVSVQYDLHVGHLRDLAPRDVQGRCDFILQRGADGGWFVLVWEDYRVGSDPCWSDLKAFF